MKPKLVLTAICLMTFSALNTVAAPIIRNGSFSNGLTHWQEAPKNGKKIELNSQDGGIILEAEAMNLGLQTARIKRDGKIDVSKTYAIQFQIAMAYMKKGTFACSIKYYDARGKQLPQQFIYRYTPKAKPHSWLKISRLIGAGSKHPIPDNAYSMLVRFSFWDKTGDCQGKVMIKDVELVSQEPPVGNTWPNDIVADVGDLQVRFDKKTFWNLRRIDYKGKRLCIDAIGTYYGTVLNFPGTGFIGTGHTENEDEALTKLSLLIDGKDISNPKQHYTCTELAIKRESTIRNVKTETSVIISNNIIREKVTLSVKEPVKLKFAFLFMHPWVTSFSDYLSLDKDKTIRGSFCGDKKRKINQQVKVSAVYNKTLNLGAVTIVKEATTPWKTQYWDVDGRYRKHYFEILKGQSLQPDKTYIYDVITIPFAASADQWQQVAEKVVTDNSGK